MLRRYGYRFMPLKTFLSMNATALVTVISVEGFSGCASAAYAMTTLAKSVPLLSYSSEPRGASAAWEEAQCSSGIYKCCINFENGFWYVSTAYGRDDRTNGSTPVTPAPPMR